ncbi:MAG: hypothetical protein H6P98_2263 [Candidatus Aminicenantes bacterium]|jgi:hypothetical protein|nr:hypothetical protein [Candidatus Aminicenantes bacterium]
MKRAIALTLAAFIFLSVFFWLPRSAAASVPADLCYDDWEGCRQRAFQSDEGFIRTVLWLTVCDVGLGKCLLHL